MTTYFGVYHGCGFFIYFFGYNGIRANQVILCGLKDIVTKSRP